MDWLLGRLALLVPLVLSLSVHEAAHAWSAYKLGDDTAKRAGRLTLNPVAHVDPVGTILLPLLGVPFGWAKPVPVDVRRFRQDVDPRVGMMLTAAAGPLSNVALVVVLLAITVVAVVALPLDLIPVALLETAIAMNVALAVFNALPIPPLDGSRVVVGLLPARAYPAWLAFTRVAPLVLLAVVLMPIAGGVSLVEAPMRWTFELLDWMIRQLPR